jgi:hypothetical protein
MTTGIALITAIINLGLLLLLAYQLRLLSEQLKQDGQSVELDHSRRKAQATLEFSTATLAKQEQWKHLLPDYYRDEQDVRRSVLSIDSKDPLDSTLQDFIGFFEELATGVNLGVYDVDIVDHLMGTRVIRAFKAFEPWIERRREEYGVPGLYREFQTLAEAIERRRASAV